ncbi:amidohydrolase family protein [Burkholderia glumae]|uniref:amidohydrolase family protein n=1 Tax=Burkholderia glumae TaxID=337 RepID=UPI0003A5B57B|nr:amidohydrolase family protein [Burkholderia glumae]MCM2494960.1 amidohydrolase family protein [Burkholderia glumae]MCM2545825.1 amidohydrolase family protein [Burkholderia glumae]
MKTTHPASPPLAEAGLSAAGAAWLAAGAPAVTGIDSHAHLFLSTLPLAAQRRHAPDYDATLDAYVAHLSAHGLSHGVLVQPSFLGTDNSWLAAVAGRYPRRFRGVAVVDPCLDEAALGALAASGIVGARLNLIGLPLPDLRAGPWPAFLARINALGWHLELHRGAADLPVLLDALLAQRCTVVVDHFGRPDPASGARDAGFRHLLAQADGGRVWVKLSAAYRSAGADDGEALARVLASQLLAAFGTERLVWGSDWPHTQHRHLVDYAAAARALRRWVPDDAQRQAILTTSARELFRF